jgi:hypothetical protein
MVAFASLLKRTTFKVAIILLYKIKYYIKDYRNPISKDKVEL